MSKNKKGRQGNSDPDKLLIEKAAFADRPKVERERIQNWILKAYHEKIEEKRKQVPNAAPKRKTGREFMAEIDAQERA